MSHITKRYLSEENGSKFARKGEIPNLKTIQTNNFPDFSYKNDSKTSFEESDEKFPFPMHETYKEHGLK